MSPCPKPGLWAGPLQPDTSQGELTIGGVSMHDVRWNILSLAQLYDDPSLRGDDRLLPGVRGVIAYRRRATVTRRSLPMMISGWFDLAGNTVADPDAQLVTTMRYLKANVTLPTNVGDGTRSATLALPDGTVITENIHVLALSGELVSGALWAGTLELSDPTGNLHAGGTP